MNRDGTITPDEFDAIHRVLTDKLSHYDAALTKYMIAMRENRQAKVYKPQCQYWQHCMAAIKDTLSYARSLIRVSHDSETVRSVWQDSEGRGDSDSSNETRLWDESE